MGGGNGGGGVALFTTDALRALRSSSGPTDTRQRVEGWVSLVNNYASAVPHEMLEYGQDSLLVEQWDEKSAADPPARPTAEPEWDDIPPPAPPVNT